MKTILLSTFFMLASMGIFMGCKKNNDKNIGCRIIEVKFPLTGTSEFLTYNSDNKLERVINGTTADVYTYAGNTITIDQYDSAIFRNRTIATLNTGGLAINVRKENDPAGASWSNSVNEYDGDEIIKSTSTSSNSTDTSITTYTWNDHNMTTAVSGTDTTRFEYYTDQPRQAGDFLSVLQMLQGFEIYRTKNLLKSYGGVTFTYDHDPSGKITSLQEVGGAAIGFLDFEYECN